MKLRISRLGSRGDGIAETPEGPVYVPFAAPGDIVEARPGASKGEGRGATLENIVEPGLARIEPVCRHFATCGGCAVQHLDTDTYAAWKRDLVVTALARHGLETEIAPLVSMPPGARRKVRVAFRRTAAGPILGFRGPSSRHIVDLRECVVSHPDIVAMLPALRGFLNAIVDRAEIDATHAANGLDVTVHAAEEPGLDALEAGAEFADRSDLARLSWRAGDGASVPLVVRREPMVAFGAVPLRLPPAAFLQPTEAGENALRSVVEGALPEAARVADLYAGCGAFGLPLAAAGKSVHLIEGITAQTGAALSAARVSGIASRVTGETRDLVRRPLEVTELDGYDGVILDPPRAGAAPQSERLARSQVPRIVYVSCNPATFARDARTLADGGYGLRAVTPVDQFVWTPHLETAAVFERD